MAAMADSQLTFSPRSRTRDGRKGKYSLYIVVVVIVEVEGQGGI